jgi:molybdopterin-guanine dinucleotide biosynthesis protein MobB
VTRLESGLDVLLAGAARPRGRVGLLCNPASVTLDFVPAPQALLAAGVDVRVLFGPEHGLTGAAQDMEAVGPGEPSRLPVISLYGETEGDLAPKPEHLAGLDAVVCDLPDVGSRYYTFVWSIALVMRECAKRKLPVVVLDRPNPLGGEVIEGNLPEAACLSFVGLYPVPVRHGMTPGEIARWTNATQGFGCDLTVVPLRKDSRAPTRREIAETPAWVLPSPNMPTPGTALVYPGACLVEGTNLSEGRGTTRPFELLGAPWLDADEAAERANALALPGVVFRPHVFIPTFQKQAGMTCGGVQTHVTDAEAFRPYETYLRLLKALRDMNPERFQWRTETYEYRDDMPAIDLLTGTPTYRRLVDAGESLDGWISTFQRDVAKFDADRREHLLYSTRRNSPAVLLVTGAHESGKTTVAVQLIAALAKEGLRVGSLKHTDHEYDTDVEGKDSQRHRAAGANPAVLAAGRRSAVHAASRDKQPLSVFLEGECGLRDRDVVVVEGYRSEAYPKIEVCRAATGRAPLCEADPNVLAVVTDRPTSHASSVPRFTFEEVSGSLLLFLKKSPVFSSLLSGGAS